MAFEDLTEQLKDQWTQLSHRVQESDAFLQLKEKYDSLSPSMQKIVKISSFVFALLVTLSIPYSMYSGSTEAEENFVYYRDMTRMLLKAESEAKNIQQIGRSLDENQLQTRARSAIMSVQLQPSQISGIKPLTPPTADRLKGIPNSVKRAGVHIALKNLNLKQILQISNRLETIDSSVKVWGIEVKTTPENSLYYDVDYQLISFYIPQEKPSKKNPSSRRPRRGS